MESSFSPGVMNKSKLVGSQKGKILGVMFRQKIQRSFNWTKNNYYYNISLYLNCLFLVVEIEHTQRNTHHNTIKIENTLKSCQVWIYGKWNGAIQIMQTKSLVVKKRQTLVFALILLFCQTRNFKFVKFHGQSQFFLSEDNLSVDKASFTPIFFKKGIGIR